MESGVVSKPEESGSYIWVVLLTVFFIVLFYGLQSIANVAEIKRNWPKYRCAPSVIPFASLYGYDVGENFNYCVKNILAGQMGEFTGPFGTILTSLIKTSMGFLQNLNSLRVMLATLVGGVTKIFQELTDRIKLMMSQIKTTSLRMQTLMKRVFAVFYAVIYMGLSAVQTGKNFTETFIFQFMDTFCFDGSTLIHVKEKGLVPIRDIQLGDILENGARVISVYRFMADGQPMVRFPGDILVSGNHYIQENGIFVRADKHSDAIKAPNWNGGTENLLYCLDTDTHTIPVGNYIFSDYDETNESDSATMEWIEQTVNGEKPTKQEIHKITRDYDWFYQPCCDPSTPVVMKNGPYKQMKDVQIGDILTTGRVTGIVKRHTYVVTVTPHGTRVTPSTLVWSERQKWERAGHVSSELQFLEKPIEMIQFVVMNTAQFETVYGDTIRDFVEVHSPDSETITADVLHANNNTL